MKIKFIITFLLISTNIIFSQEKIIKTNGNEIITVDNVESGKVENGIYTCYMFDWKIKIPENYNVIDTKKLEELERNGNNEITKRTDNVKVQNTIALIGFSLDKKNSFSSNFNPLSEPKYNLEEAKKASVANLNKILSTIKGAEFKYTTTDVKIGKYQFFRIKVEGFNSNNQLLITQIYYNAYVQNHLFGVLITYNNEKEGNVMEANFVSSLE
ncbi:MAG: hypothetical protein RIQ59_1638 [Bacteroidota bacterium]|jgi:hypothetical protein